MVGGVHSPPQERKRESKMKRWVILGVSLFIFVAFLFVKPPAFTTNKYPNPPVATSQPSTKPGVPAGDEYGGKPAYGGHEADEYGETPKK